MAIKICEPDSGVRRDDGRKNEFSALIIAKMAIKICESDNGASRNLAAVSILNGIPAYAGMTAERTRSN